MTYAFDFVLLGLTPGLTDLRAQLVDSGGANVGAAISTGFTDMLSGFYIWYAAAIPSGHRGGVKFYSNAAPTVTLAFQAINPQINEVWSNATRTLTQSAAQVAATVAGSVINVLRGDTFSIALTGLGSLTGYVTLDFTVKLSPNDSDADAVLRIRKNASAMADGLLRLNGAAVAPADASHGSITINDEALGNITIALAAAEAAQLVVNSYTYDVQKVGAAAVGTLTEGTFIVSADVTRAVA